MSSRAPVLARKSPVPGPVLAVRCVPTDANRSPVLAAETSNPGSSGTPRIAQSSGRPPGLIHEPRRDYRAPLALPHATMSSTCSAAVDHPSSHLPPLHPTCRWCAPLATSTAGRGASCRVRVHAAGPLRRAPESKHALRTWRARKRSTTESRLFWSLLTTAACS
jgi:hypothetical protein